jgi:hypothetical protein
MANLNEISVLRKLPVKPAIWRMEQQENGNFRLAYSYMKISSASWQYVMTQRCKIKEYKTAGTCLGDIAKVQTKATIHAVLNPITD